MVGRVLDATGSPIEGVSVETVEARSRTDAEGHFAVGWKKPAFYVHFWRDDLWYRRRLQPEDEGVSVDLQLPALSNRMLSCELRTACEAELIWDLGSGFSAKATAHCEPDTLIDLKRVPSSTPEVTCRPSASAGTLGLHVHDGEPIRVTPPLVPVRVEVRADTPEPPALCDVRVDNRTVATVEGGWEGRAWGDVTVSATCDGWPAAPASVKVTEPGTAFLEWSPTGPSIDFAGHLNGVDTFFLARAGQWMIELKAGDGGVAALPPLSAGSYVLASKGAAVAVVGGSESGVAYLHVDPDTGAFAGVLNLDADVLDGRIGVEIIADSP